MASVQDGSAASHQGRGNGHATGAHGKAAINAHQLASLKHLVSPEGKSARYAAPLRLGAFSPAVPGSAPSKKPASIRTASALHTAHAGVLPAASAENAGSVTAFSGPAPASPVFGGSFTSMTEFTDSSSIPPDAAVAAGPMQVVDVVNGRIKTFNRNGSQASSASLQAFFSALGAPATDGPFDPRAFYDPYLGRFWVVAASSHDSTTADPPNRSSFLIALSNGSDASAGWQLFAMDATLNSDIPTGNWCDYPMLGVDAQAIYLSCNMFSFPTTASTPQYAKVRIMTKDQFVANTCCSWYDFWNLREAALGVSPAYTVQPARMYGASVGDGEYMVDAHTFCILCTPHTLEVWHITNAQDCCNGSSAAPILDQAAHDVGAYPTPPGARQPATSTTIDTGDGRLLYGFWKNGHLSTGQNLGCTFGGACIAYTELAITGGLSGISTVSDFEYGAVGVDYLYPAVDVNSAGNMSMVFSLSSSTQFISTSYTGIPASSTCTDCVDGPELQIGAGQSTYVQFDCTPGTSNCNPRNRWGDYSAAAADPDGVGIWVHGEFSGSAGIWQTQVALTYEAQDTTPPVTVAQVVPMPNAAGWNRTNAFVNMMASDPGSGVRSVTFVVSGAQITPPITVMGATASILIGMEGTSVVTFSATDNAGNIEPSRFQLVRIDRTAPVIACSPPDTSWHALDVSILCTAVDPISGLADIHDASFLLSTSVPPDFETDSAGTDARLICDVAGNCADAGPVGPFMVDKRQPNISILAPASTNYTLNQVVPASYSCVDYGSGVATCAGPVANGANIDTSTAGKFTFTVISTDNVGNFRRVDVIYTVGYDVCLLYDPTHARHAGTTIPVRLEVCDASGADVSSAGITLTAVAIVDSSGAVVRTLAVNFRFEPTLGTAGGYILNLSTRGLAPGNYTLVFRAGTDTHSIPFVLS